MEEYKFKNKVKSIDVLCASQLTTPDLCYSLTFNIIKNSLSTFDVPRVIFLQENKDYKHLV